MPDYKIDEATVNKILGTQTILLETQFKQAAATERIEMLLGSNALNNNMGLVAQVQDHTKRLVEIESYVKTSVIGKTEGEKRSSKNMIVIGLIFTVVQILISVITIKK